jgi:organic radical activating enzyme
MKQNPSHRIMKTENRPIGIFDLTNQCPLRCLHCYYYSNVSQIPSELGEADFLERLEQRREEYGIRSAFWVGGEPLLKPDLLRQAMRLFRRNAVATSGALPIPADLNAGLLVSIEGGKQTHDGLRGEGTFDIAMENVRSLPAKSFAIATTLTSASVECIDTLPDLVVSTGAVGILVGFHVGRPGDPLRLDGRRRDAAVDKLLDLQESHPGVLLHSKEAIELFRWRHGREVREHCIYRDRAVAFDVRLEVKKPCTFAENAACNVCGCPVVIAHAAWRKDDAASADLLHALFPKHAAVTRIPNERKLA